MRLAFGLAVALVFLVCLFTCNSVSAQQLTTFSPALKPPEFITFAQPDRRIALARDRILEILDTNNSCSLWFRRVDPNPADTFTSLKFHVDSRGPQYVIGLRSDSGAMLFKHPYSARTLENAGRGSVITLNANGPFFVRLAPVLQAEIPGSSLHHAGWMILQVGSYLGSTPGAQITTLLHEFAHVVGRIPADPDSLNGQSGRNTAEVLHYCRAQINAADRALRRLEP